MSKNPTRDYAIEFLLRKGLTAAQAAAVLASVPATTTDATGTVFGDVSGSLLGPLIVMGLLGYPVDGPPEDGKTIVFDLASGTWLLATPGGIDLQDDGVSQVNPAPVLNFRTGLTADASGNIDATGGSGSGTPGWFNVKDPAYGATGDGTTDDTAAINLAIAALIAAGRGVLYFPAGTYKVTAGLTTISVPCLVLGDGWLTGASGPVTQLNLASTTASLFTVSANGCVFRDMGMEQTAGTATAGAAITTTGGTLAAFEGLLLTGFYTGIDIENSNIWTMRRCYMENLRKYGVRIRNTAAPDTGDWVIEATAIANSVAADAAIRVETSGGGKIVACKISGTTSGSARYAYGIDIAIPTGVATTILLVDATSIENVTTDAIHITTTGTGQYGLMAINGVQVGLYGNNSGRAVNVVAAATGGTFTAGGIGDVVIDGCVFRTDGTARAAVSITKTDNVVLGDIALSGFNARYTGSGDTNTTDGASVTFATPAIVLGTAAAAGAASTVIRSDATIVAFDATAPTTQALGDAAATGSAAVAARRDHKHAMPALSTATPLVESGSGAVGTGLPSSREDHVHPAAAGTAPTEAQVYGVGGHWELLMDPATSSPPVPLTTPDGTDWVYGWLSDGG